MKDFREQHPTADSLDDNGCKRLAAAIILQTAVDLYESIQFDMRHPTAPTFSDLACSVKSIRDFVYSEWYGCLTDIDADTFINTVVQWYCQKRDLARFINTWRNKLIMLERSESTSYYEPGYLRNLLNDSSFRANWAWNKRRMIKLDEWV